ncbi:MAG TPA: hypothetical protein VNY36_05270 [Bacteroidia bacterium]|nr:hypothetical protein [Bacteroidia bacterium]
MKNTINKQAEILKKSIDSVSKNSKESIKTLIESNTKHFDSAVESNKKTFDSISKLLYEKEIDPSIISAFKAIFGKGFKLSEDVIDSIIDSHTERIDLSIDFTAKFMELVKSEDLNKKEGVNGLIELVKENFNQSTGLSMRNMEKFVSIYNEHLNLALNFNKKFADNINSQVESMFRLQKRNFNTFFSLDSVTNWWKVE